MDMIGQEGPGVHRDRPGLGESGQAGHERGAIRIVPEDRPPLNPAGHDVMEDARGVQARATAHDARVRAAAGGVKKYPR
jgi:hypothetical protein